MFCRSVVASLVALSMWCSTALGQTGTGEVVARIGPSVLTVRTFAENGQRIDQGSGFLLEDKRVVTSTNVLRGAANVEVFDSAGQLVGVTQYAEVMSNTVDLAILPAIQTDLPGLALADGEPPVGTRILVIGAPEGQQNAVADGLVDAIRDIDSRRLIQISAPVSDGSSGGAVVDLSGQVIGVSLSLVDDGQNLNFAVPAHNIRILAGSPAGRVTFDDTSSSPGPASRGTLLPIGETVTSELRFGLPSLPDGSLYESWYFEGRRGERYRISMKSREFDSFLFLGRIVNGQFIVLERTDGLFGLGLNARINHTLPADGEYVIRANSFWPSRIGEYTLELERR